MEGEEKKKNKEKKNEKRKRKKKKEDAFIKIWFMAHVTAIRYYHQIHFSVLLALFIPLLIYSVV